MVQVVVKSSNNERKLGINQPPWDSFNNNRDKTLFGVSYTWIFLILLNIYSLNISFTLVANVGRMIHV